jgi:hypothetical protein
MDQRACRRFRVPASYNLAAIYAQNGQRDKALQLLRRHFFQYERYQAVRSKEMMEARVDAVLIPFGPIKLSSRSPAERTASCRCRWVT